MDILNIKELPLEERPREKAAQYGIESLSNRELLALVLRHGYKECSSLFIADELLKLSQGMANLANLDLKQLTSIKGIHNAKGLQLLACFEIAKRMLLEKTREKEVISDPQVLTRWLQMELGLKQQEVLMVLYLNVKNEILHHETLFKGTLDHSLVHPREIFKQALVYNGSKIILVHNHPSGNIEPSIKDINVTEQMIEIGELMKIEVLDHLIISRNKVFSFKQAGLMG